jgi:hypothetical protein
VRVHDATATAYSNAIAATELQQLARVNVLYLHILEFPARIQPSASISVGSPPPSSICVAPSPPVGPTTLPPTIIHILSNHCPLQRTHPVVARDGPTRSVARRWSSAGTRWFKVTSAAPTTTFTHDRSMLTLIGNNRTVVDLYARVSDFVGWRCTDWCCSTCSNHSSLDGRWTDTHMYQARTRSARTVQLRRANTARCWARRRHETPCLAFSLLGCLHKRMPQQQ